MKRYLLGLALALALTTAAAQQRVRTNFTRHRSITPSDTNLVADCQRIYITTAGNIAIEDSAGTIIVYAVANASTLDLVPYRIRATSTTATGIVCWY